MGRSGIAMLRLSGSSSIDIAKKMAPNSRLWKHGCAVVGSIYYDDGRVLDQVVITTFIAPKSFTGENTVELGCHGNPLIIDAIIQRAIQLGARLARAGEFTRQAVINGKMSFLKAEALNELIHATSFAGVSLAHKGLSGHIDDQEKVFRNHLLDVAAELEAKMDYPQEDLSYETDQDISQILSRLADKARKSAASYKQNRIRLHGAKVVLLGPVNAGKSSLFNHIVGTKRAIVSSQPGTTRDIVERRVLLDGLEVSFFDTAGTRLNSSDPIENEGMQMGIEMAQEADLCLLVCPANESGDVIEAIKRKISRPFLIVATHSDVSSKISFDFDILVSNTRITGINELNKKIRTVLGVYENQENTLISLSLRQQSIFYMIADHIDVASEALNGFLGPAVATEEITLALEQLALLRGDDAREQVLDRLFSKFCIGK